MRDRTREETLNLWQQIFHPTPHWVEGIHTHLRVSEHRTKEHILAAQDTVNELTAQVLKSKTEVLGKIADLEAAVAAGEAPDFSELRAAVQGVDDIVADAPVAPEDEPTSETPEQLDPEAPAE